MTLTDDRTMATEQTDATPARPASVLRRRGLVAGAAALAAALLARQSNDRVLAADGSSVQIGHAAAADTNNIYATTTSMTNGTAPTPEATLPNNTTTAPTAGFRVFNSYPYGTPGTVVDPTADAIEGFAASANNSGVHGRNDSLNGIGTTGVASNGTGAYGQSAAGSGVGGSSTSGAGGYFQSTSGTGVFAQSTSGYGIITSTTSGVGVYSVSTNLTGVYGQTSGGSQYGVIGVGAAPGTFGLAGIANQNNSASFAGGTTNATCYAASFAGGLGVSISGNTVITQNLSVGGNFAVTGTKSAALKHTDGSQRLVYAIESPEEWMEDFGKDKLSGGTAQVKFDADFLGVMDTNNYHVFLSEYDGQHGLYVTQQTPNGFTVKSNDPAGANASFSWRAVTKAKGRKVTRLAKFDMPKAHDLDVEKLTANLPKPPSEDKGRGNGPASLPKRKP